MKKIGWMKLVFFISLCSKFGACDSPCTPDISIDSLKLDTIQAKSICQIYPKNFVDDNKKAFFDENCFAENSEIGFVSLLDTTVAFFISWEKDAFWITLWRNYQQCSETYPNDTTYGTPGTHPFSEVLKFELTHLQKLGVIKNDIEEFKILVEKWITEKIATNKKCPGSIDWATTGIGPGCCSLVETSTGIRFQQLQKNEKPFAHKLTGNVFRIEGVSEQAAYRLFDLNGKLLRTGNLSGNQIKLPTLPAILEIEGRSILVK